MSEFEPFASTSTLQNKAQLIRFVTKPLEPLEIVKDEPAFVLTTWPWKESSLIVELLTRHHGRVTVTARGVKRKGSRFRGILQAFSPLKVSFSGRGEVKNLTAAKWLGSLVPQTFENLMVAQYVNELVMRLTAKENPQVDLFDLYRHIITVVASEKGNVLERELRTFEVDLLRLCGWGQRFEDLPVSKDYSLRSGELVAADSFAIYPEEDLYSASVVRTVLTRDFASSYGLEEARRLIQAILNYYVGERGLKVRDTVTKWRHF